MREERHWLNGMVHLCPFVSVLRFLGRFVGTAHDVPCPPGNDVPNAPFQTCWGGREASPGCVQVVGQPDHPGLLKAPCALPRTQQRPMPKGHSAPFCSVLEHFGEVGAYL